MMKKLYPLLIILLSLLVLSSPILFFLYIWEYPDWKKTWHPEYRRIMTYSKPHQEVFEQRLLSKMEKESAIYIRDLVDFEWDTVCVMEGYSHLREDVASKYNHGKDIPELEYFPHVQESHNTFVFLQGDKLIAIIDLFEPGLMFRYIFSPCASPSSARLKLIEPNAQISFEKGTKANRYIVHPINLKQYEGCIGTQCELTFYGR